jgi:hypothetical protein
MVEIIKKSNSLNHMNLHHQNSKDVIQYDEKWDEYQVDIPGFELINFRSSVVQVIVHCPWCGVLLPTSKRDLWYDKIEKMGFDPNLEPEKIPLKFRSAEWWTELDDG